MPILPIFTHDYRPFPGELPPPMLYWQRGTNSIYFAKGNVFDYDYYGFDGLIVQYRPALSCLNADCSSLIRENDAEGFPEIPILIIGFNECMLFINPDKDLESKALIDRHPEAFREMGRKGALRRYIIDGQDTERALHDKPFAPSRGQIPVLVDELLSTLEKQGCKHIGFHGIYNRDYEDCEYETVQAVKDWFERDLHKGIRVTMVDHGDSYNKRLNQKDIQKLQ